MSEPLFPKQPQLHDHVPPALLTGQLRLEELADEYRPAVEALPRKARQLTCMLYLAHTGRLKDSTNKIMFDLSPLELASWTEQATGRTVTDTEVEAFTQGEGEGPTGPSDALVRFYRRRECRIAGEPVNCYRFAHGVFPVVECR